MKKLALALAVLILLAAAICYNVWRADQDPVTATPSPLETGRLQLHNQLLESEQRESEIEQQDWNTVTLLRDLIQAHQQRIDKLAGNTQAGEILAHDRDAIARIQSRIAELEAQQREQPAPQQQPIPSATRP
ncbi:MAG TPA: hypothetical protein VG225_03650 [Terracidiphilus sp.]|jgi:hypothetical protein|nr:hypothetical protein [Terracidiphilus sp.]